MRELEITQPDDWHCHLRDGEYLSRTVADTAAHFRRAIIMPNLKTPVRTVNDARSYRKRILAALPQNSPFQPLMTLYLTDETTPADIAEAKASGIVFGAKLYPQGATTHSEAGVTKIEKMSKTFEAMSEHHLPLLIHGEVTDPDIDVFDKEKYFIDRVMLSLVTNFPSLRMVLEHITTQEAVQFIENTPSHIGATITPHHLIYNRNAMFKGGVRPHYYCLPILKRQAHQLALIQAATSGNPKFFIGTDSAPHSNDRKESSCGCAGIYNAPVALALYAEVFDEHNKLNNLEAFLSFHGPDFYHLPRNDAKITLRREPVNVPQNLPFGQKIVIPLRAGHTVQWHVTNPQEV